MVLAVAFERTGHSRDAASRWLEAVSRAVSRSRCARRLEAQGNMSSDQLSVVHPVDCLGRRERTGWIACQTCLYTKCVEPFVVVEETMLVVRRQHAACASCTLTTTTATSGSQIFMRSQPKSAARLYSHECTTSLSVLRTQFLKSVRKVVSFPYSSYRLIRCFR